MSPINNKKLAEQGDAPDGQFAFLRIPSVLLHCLNLCSVFLLTLFLTGCSQEDSIETVPHDKNGAVANESLPPLKEPEETETQQIKQMPKATKSLKGQGSTAIEKPQQKKALHIEKLSDREHLNELGFEFFESQRLLLVSDGVPPEKREIFEQLPGIADQLAKRFRSDYPQTSKQFQLTGYVMRDRSLYLQAGLLPEDFANLAHGLHQGRSFWMNDQKTDYYRRHLLIHEAVHCLMDIEQHRWPVWYLEGMAEFYAIHQIANDGKVQFGILPANLQIAGGFGRLPLIRDEIAAGRFQTVSKIRQLNVNNFYPHKTSYAWSWALCHFLATHSETQKEFQQLGMYRDSRPFNQFFDQAFPAEDARLNAQWAVFVSSLVASYDIKRGSITWSKSQELNSRIVIQTNRNWQGNGVQVVKGKEYRIEADGRFSVAQKPVPWNSEPQGVSIDYVDGQPLGQLQAALFASKQPGEHHDHGFLQIISVGRLLFFKPTRDGELFFRVNDRGSSWSNNKGSITISVKETGR